MNAELGLRSIVRPQKTDYEQGKPRKVLENKLQQNFMSDKINTKMVHRFHILIFEEPRVMIQFAVLLIFSDRSVIAEHNGSAHH